MAEQHNAKGQCLCGAVHITATLPKPEIQACHCSQCQRWTGGGPLYAIRVKDLEITGEDAIQTYNASEWGQRAFCGTCGTNLYWKLQGRSTAFVSPGLLDDKTGLELTEEIFIDHRPGWLPARAGASQSTEADMKAQLTAFLEGEAE